MSVFVRRLVCWCGALAAVVLIVLSLARCAMSPESGTASGETAAGGRHRNPGYGYELTLPQDASATDTGMRQTFRVSGSQPGESLNFSVSVRRATDDDLKQELGLGLMALVMGEDFEFVGEPVDRYFSVGAYEAGEVDFVYTIKEAGAHRLRNRVILDGARVIDVVVEGPIAFFAAKASVVDSFFESVKVTEAESFKPKPRPKYTGPKTESAREKAKE